jgi:hypothetical protein
MLLYVKKIYTVGNVLTVPLEITPVFEEDI